MGRLLPLALVLLVVLVVGDRLAAGFAARAVAAQLQSAAALAEPPEVAVGGVPFLTQAVRGRYDRLEVRAVRVPAGEVSFAELTATLSGVGVPLTDILSGTVDSVPVDVVDGRGLLSYDTLSRRSGDRDLTVTPVGNRLRVEGSVPVAGRRLAAAAVSSVTIEGNDLVVTAQSIEVGNSAADAVLSRALRGRLDLRVPIGRLPYGLQVTGVAVEPDGVAFRAGARDVVLTPR